MDYEKNYTSTGNKLLGHLDRLQLAQNGCFRPINLQISPTNKCNLNCSFCSVKNRKPAELPIGDCYKIIDYFLDVGPIYSVEITGGGDPTMYSELRNLILYCVQKHVKVGLITNGVVLLDVLDQYTLDRLEWLRISLNALDYGIEPRVPSIKGTLGFSYVWHSKSKIKVLDRINELYASKGEYVRIVPDCLDFKTQEILRKDVDLLIKSKGYSRMFVQTKSYSVHRPCLIGALKPCVYSDGFVYQCTATALYNRDFGKEWRICHWKDIKKVWPYNFKPFHAKCCYEGKCFYAEHNKILTDLHFKVKNYGFI